MHLHLLMIDVDLFLVGTRHSKKTYLFLLIQGQLKQADIGLLLIITLVKIAVH